jgi:ATP-dependent DNA ligase
MQEKFDTVELNMSGRNLDEQIELEIRSRINKQLDKGYRHTRDEAHEAKGMNVLNLARPMLAKVYNQQDLTGCFMQYKFDGHRILVTRQNDELIAYSRNGKLIHTIDHILEYVDIPEGTTLDGELYIHGMPLQQISSLVRKVQPDNIKLKYIVYDQISDKRFADRFDEIAKFRLGDDVFMAVTNDAHNDYEPAFAYAKKEGYEGLIARQNNVGYEAGKRSTQLLKIKTRFDFEAEVIAIIPSADGWAVLTCIAPNGKTFGVTAPGTMKQKHEIMDNAALYIGKMLTVECAEYTVDGMPFHPVAIAFREEE